MPTLRPEYGFYRQPGSRPKGEHFTELLMLFKVVKPSGKPLY